MSAPRAPGGPTVSRNRALDIGTDPAGFTGAPNYIPQAGMPAGSPGSGLYKEAPEVGMSPGDAESAPFTVTGG